MNYICSYRQHKMHRIDKLIFAYKKYHPRQKSLTRSLILNLIVKCGLPISIVDDENFRAFLSHIDPKVDYC